MKLYTIGFTKKTAKHFFGLIKGNNIQILLDIRLNNNSQLAGFTKGDDLRYFLSEICQCKYLHYVEYAPTKDILTGYKKKDISWHEYEKQYASLMEKRGNHTRFSNEFSDYDTICLLCSEPEPDHCHRRLIAEMIQSANPDIDLIHI